MVCARSFAAESLIPCEPSRAISALDAPTEARLFATLRSLKSEMTVMAIAHRVTADAGFDRVLRLENGRIG